MTTPSSQTASRKGWMFPVLALIFVLLAALPIARIHALWVTIPLYCVILLLLKWSARAPAALSKILSAFAGLGTLGLLAVYGYYLLPRRNIISLGTAEAKSGLAPKILFFASGIYAILTIAPLFWKSFRSAKQRTTGISE